MSNVDVKFPKTVVIKRDHPYGLPNVNCMGCRGVAIKAINNDWLVEFMDLDCKHQTFSFFKNDLEVIA